MSPQTENFDVISDENFDKAQRLAGAVWEIIENWMTNNQYTDPYIVLTALSRVVVLTITASDCQHCRTGAAASVIDAILEQSKVTPAEVLQEVSLMATKEKFDA